MSNASPIGTVNVANQTIRANDGWARVGKDVFQLVESRDEIDVVKRTLAAIIPPIAGQPSRAIDSNLEQIDTSDLFAEEGNARQRAIYLNNTLEIANGERVKEGDIGWQINQAGPKMVVFYRRRGHWRMVSPECCSFKSTDSGVKVTAPSGQGRGGGHVIRRGQYCTTRNYHASNVYRTLQEAKENHAGIIAAAVRNGQVQGMMSFAGGSVAGFVNAKLTYKDWTKITRQWAAVFG